MGEFFDLLNGRIDLKPRDESQNALEFSDSEDSGDDDDADNDDDEGGAKTSVRPSSNDPSQGQHQRTNDGA